MERGNHGLPSADGARASEPATRPRGHQEDPEIATPQRLIPTSTICDESESRRLGGEEDAAANEIGGNRGITGRM